MNKIYSLSLLILALLIALTLAACGEGDDGQGDTDGTPPSSDQVPEDDAAEAVELNTIVYSDKLIETPDFRLLINAYFKKEGKRLSTVASTADKAEGEVVFGETDRAVSVKAMRKLNVYLRESNQITWDSISYIIYVKDGSIGVLWDKDGGADLALEKLIEYLQSETPVLVEGFEEITTVKTNAVLEEEEKASLEKMLAALGEEFGAEVVSAVRDHLALFDDRFYLWLADLYEPRTCICDNYDEYGYRECLLPKDENGNYICHGGGFYYSNSARDTLGYDIDVESTMQVFNFISVSGMIDSFGGSLYSAIPKQMQNDVVAFAKSLQSSEDGYFYHPQWGTAVGTSRIGRDVGWATNIISTFKQKPLYNTPNGYKGTLGDPGKGSAMTEPINTSVVAAVSKVTVAASWPDYLETVEAFRTYIRSFNLATSSYGAGNTLTSIASQILTRDAEGVKNGEFKDENNDGVGDNGFVKAFEEYFNEMQNPENGLWESGVYYDSVNGLMKISSAYNKLNLKFPNGVKAVESAAAMAMLGENVSDAKGTVASAAVDVYNPWVAMSAVISNIEKYGDKDEAAALRESLRSNAAEMVRITTEKTKKFGKADGSYGYSSGTSPAHSQGVSVAVPGTVEGDVNGGCIALRGIWSSMCAVLGIEIPIYYRSDFNRFIYRINELEPVIKHTPVELSSDPITFEDETVGSSFADRTSVTTDKGGVVIANDPKNANNKVLKLYNSPSTSSGTDLNVLPAVDMSGSCLILEWDMYVESSSNSSTAFQIRIGDAYMFTVGMADGKVSFGDSSSTGSGVKTKFQGTVSFGEWNNIRLEFYPAGDGETEGPKTKIYVNKTLIAVSDNYFGKETSRGVSTAYLTARFYALQALDLVVYFDNILPIKVKKEYVKETVGTIGGEQPGGDTPGDGEEPEGGNTPGGTVPTPVIGSYDFECDNAGLELTPNTQETGNSMSVITDPSSAANKLLAVQTKASSAGKGNSVSYKAKENAPTNASCYVFEFDIEIDTSYSTKDFTCQLYMSKTTKSATNISSVNLKYKYSNGAYSLKIEARNDGGASGGAQTGAIAENIAVAGRMSLRMEYYKSNGMCKIYVNGTYVGELVNAWSKDNSTIEYGYARYLLTSGAEIRVLLDNVKVEAIDKAYVTGNPA